MKSSRYCFLHGIEEGKGLLFSSANGALAELDSESYQIVKYLLSNNSHSKSESHKELLKALFDNGFMVADDDDEITAIEKESHNERWEGKTLSLTIAPTLACNFGCDYCFEDHSITIMSDDTEQALLSFVENKIDHIDKLQTTWFGGEPTLCVSIIERLQSIFNNLAKRSGVNFGSSSIITNGYLLNKSMANRLKSAGISLAQITLDGPRKIHDARRPLKNGRGSYDRIIENIIQSYKILNIAIRINVDKDNIDSSIDVIHDLNKYGILSDINVHFAQVTASGSTCASVRDRCFTDKEFSEQKMKLYQKLYDQDIYMIDYPQVFCGGHCGAVSENSYVVSPTGDLFKCWEELSLDPLKSIGNIYEDNLSPTQLENDSKFRTWNPFEMNECRNCNILPICMGGCPIQGIKKGNENKGACSAYKFNLEDMIYLRYLINSRKEVMK